VSAVRATAEGGDLTVREATNVRTALKFLRARMGSWEPVAKVLRFNQTTLSAVSTGHKMVTATMAFRVARLARVSVDDVLTGKFPPSGTCPHCGHRAEPEAAQ
jgi:hypothetical protein